MKVCDRSIEKYAFVIDVGLFPDSKLRGEPCARRVCITLVFAPLEKRMRGSMVSKDALI